jgi:hypothetical protein
MAIDKEDINANPNLPLELNELTRDFNQALWLAFTSLPNSTTFKPRDSVTPDFVGYHGIIHGKSTSTNASSSENGLNIRIRWIPMCFIKVARLQCTLNLSLSE